MAPLTSRIDTRADSFQANAARYDDLLARLRDRMATAIRGGPDHLRARHRDRGKLLVRDRIAIRPSWSCRRWPPGGCTAAT